MSAAGFDIDAYYRNLADVHRERIRVLEREVTGLRARERHIFRVLTLALDVATGAGRDADPLLVLLALDQAATECAAIDRLAELLRATDSARIPAVRRAA